jgi:PucR C-terminal helix-turn-helix domain
MSILDERPWGSLPASIVPALAAQLPSLRDEILVVIGQEVPGYARPLRGAFGRGLRGGVEEALQQFVEQVENPDGGQARNRDVYVALGRGELRAGRGLDALQAAYRVGARVAWRRFGQVALDAGLAPDALCLLADSIFAYIDGLAADSVRGYAEAQQAAAGEQHRRRRRLVAMLLEDPPDREALSAAADAAGWAIPATLAMLACSAEELEAIARRLPPESLSAVVAELGCIAIPDPGAPGRARQIAAACEGRVAVLGPARPPATAPHSWRRARAALEAMRLGLLPAGFCRADRNLTAIATFESREPLRELAALRLEPISRLTPRGRERMTETLRAYLELRGSTQEMAERLCVHPQTVRYRRRQLRELFGADLDDPDARFELQLALRAPAPQG